MATSVAEVQAAVQTACQNLKGIVTYFKKAIQTLNDQIAGNEENLNKLRAQANPDQNTIAQIAQIEQTLQGLRDQVTQQQANLAAAEQDYESYCPPTT